MQGLLPVESDLYSIGERLKDIEGGYYVVYNLDRGKYEVHSRDNAAGHSSYCFTVPFAQLDARTLHYARKTHVSRSKELLKEMDANNEKLEQDSRRRIADASYDVGCQLFDMNVLGKKYFT